MANKVERKVFLGMDVRVVNGEWIVLKDMFDALGRVKSDGTWTDSKVRLVKFLNDINKETDHEELVVTSKGKKHSREEQTVECLKLETVPIVLTQFRPINSNKRTAEENKKALNKWREFMRFVDELLTELEVYKFIITDKERQKNITNILVEYGGVPMIANNQTNIIMAKLIGVYDKGIGKITKEELKIYQPQTTVDLLEVRSFVFSEFVNAYKFTESHKDSADMVLKLAKRKYNL